MSKSWLFTCALLATVTGCQSDNSWIGPRPQAPPMIGQSPPRVEQNVSMTQRLVNTFTPGGAKQTPQPVVNPIEQDLSNDPISLGFATGPASPELYLSMAELSDRGGNSAHARSMYRRALSIQPNHLNALLGLARLEDREGNLKQAVMLYQQAVGAHPENARALNDLALCWARSGNLTASADALEKATHMMPDKALYRNNLAKVLIEMNYLDHALANLQFVHDPAIANYNMAVLLNECGRGAEAQPFALAATRLDPQLKAAQSLLAELPAPPQSRQAPAQYAQRPPRDNDHVLPTPNTPAAAAGARYPSTGISSAAPVYQNFPAETAQVPYGYSPASLPPVR